MEIAIRMENLTKTFGEVTAVNQLSLQVRKGEIFGFLGPNGAGKTTTINMMTGLLRPTTGSIFIEGEKIGTLSAQLKRKIGICPQQVVAWERLTCLENLRLVGRLYALPEALIRQRAAELLQTLGLVEQKDVQARKLSGGMKKRLNLALALVHGPEIIVMDEPITGLDPQSRLLVSEYIRRLCREEGKTVILTTHLMEAADQLSDRVAIIDHGRLLVLDTPAQLKTTVGHGDVVEITLVESNKNREALRVIGRMDGVEEVNEIGGALTLRALNAVNILPGIFNALQAMDADIRHLSLRSNTLEDVFITLTGRGLRE